jgi:hypothetical protein
VLEIFWDVSPVEKDARRRDDIDAPKGNFETLVLVQVVAECTVQEMALFQIASKQKSDVFLAQEKIIVLDENVFVIAQ